MNDNFDLGYKVRQVLNYGTESLDPRIAARLHQARQNALSNQYATVKETALAAAGLGGVRRFTGQFSGILAAMALSLGIVGVYYWNSFQKTLENEEIDSELLADELPPSIYLDRGFQAWLNHHDSEESLQ